MPLRVVTRADTGTLWIVGTVRPAGAPEGVRVRRAAGTADKHLAREAAAALEAGILRDAWHGKRPQTRTLNEAISSYLDHEQRAPATAAFLIRISRHFGDVSLASLDQAAVDRARAALFKTGASPATVRRGLFTPLTAVLNHAAHPARRWCDPPRFDVPAEPRGRTTFLLPDQAAAILAAAEPRPRVLFTFLVCTGCRMSEALGLEWDSVDLAAARVILWEGETKGGGRRVVDLPPAAVAALAGLAHRSGRVFLTHLGRPHRGSLNGGGQVKRSWATACRRAGVDGFTPHHMRHSWASWHYVLHRDLLRLKAEGGWGQVRMCERYAHIMPSGHESAIRAIWGLTDVA